MLAVKISQFTNNPGSVHPSDVPKPAPTDGEILVEIQAAAINPSDLINISGGFDHTVLPRIVGRDFAGRVVDGPPHLLGKAVFGSGGGELGYTRDGTHAEFVVVPHDAVALRPEKLSPDEAAVAGLPFVTAWCALVDRAQLARNTWVIVAGAAGAVGNAAIQIAHYAGARTIALVKDESEIELLEREKVNAVARSERGDLENVVREATGGHGADIALNTVGSPLFHPLMASLRDRGRMAVISGIGGREVTFDLKALYRRDHAILGVNSANFTAAESARMLTEMAPAFASGQMRPSTISARFPIKDAGRAYDEAAKPNSKVVLIKE